MENTNSPTMISSASDDEDTVEIMTPENEKETDHLLLTFCTEMMTNPNLQLWWDRTLTQLLEIGALPLTTSTSIAMAIEQSHPIVISCGRLFALPRRRRPSEFVNSSRVVRLESCTSKDTLNSLGLYASNDYVSFYPGSILNEEKERGIKPVTIVLNPKLEWTDPMSTEFGNQPLEHKRQKRSQMFSPKYETDSENTPSPRRTLQRSTSRLGLGHFAPSKNSKE